jgi:ABC-2 type transport system permease protein
MTTVTAPAAAAWEERDVELPAGGLRADVRAVRVVLHRELITFFRNRVRMIVALVQPLLFLWVLGTGLSSLVRTQSGDVSFRTFIFPGVLAMAVLTPPRCGAARSWWASASAGRPWPASRAP